MLQGLSSDAFSLPSCTRNTPVLRAAPTADGARTLRVGFVGCGTIASAIATGLATQNQIDLEGIAVTTRSETKSQNLVDAFPSLVTRYDNNQDIVDQSDVIFLCVLPDQTSEVLQNIKFDSEKHTLVSLVVGFYLILFLFR